MVFHEVNLCTTSQVLCLRSCQDIVQLSYQLLDSRDELDETFRNEHRTEVVSFSSTVGNSLSDISHNIVETHILLLNLFADETDVWLTLQGTLECDVRSRTPHQLDEVPVLASGVTVALDVTNQLTVSLTSSIETE